MKRGVAGPCAAALVVACGLALAWAQEGGGGPLYVHIVPHSHCDPGWLESFEGYYGGQVASILSSVTEELVRDGRRRFIWAEISFFMRWLETQSEVVRHRVRALVKSGQLEFVGGGWVQHDEANPSYDAIISQISEGHDYLATLFGVKPRIAFSIDPFGHAASSAAIAALAGFDAVVINRIDHTVKDALKARAAMEFVWQPYAAHPALQSGGGEGEEGAVRYASYSNASIFTHVLHTHYSAPKGFDFENPEGVTVDSNNVKMRADILIGELRRRAEAYRTSHLLVLHGDDFKFRGSGAGAQFRGLDQLIAHISEHSGPGNGRNSGFHIAYSTLSEYFDAVHAESAGHASHRALFPVYPTAGAAAAAAASLASDAARGVGGSVIPFPAYTPEGGFRDGGVDFYPYADNANSWWTGYYVSRPALKQAIRRTMATLRGAEALQALVRPWAPAWQLLADALAAEQDAASTTDGEEGGASARAASLSASPYSTYSWQAAFQRLEQARLDLALTLHHDAITGTSRAEVVDDYTRRMAAGALAATAALSDMASLALGGLPRAALHSRAHARSERSVGAAGRAQRPASALLDLGEAPELGPAALTHVTHVLPVPRRLGARLSVGLAPVSGPSAATAGVGALGRGEPALREAVEAASLRVQGASRGHPVVVHNPTAWAREEVVSVLVDVGSHAAAVGNRSSGAACRLQQWPYAVVTDDEGAPVPSQWVATLEDHRASGTAGQAFLAEASEAAGAPADDAAMWRRIRGGLLGQGLGGAGTMDVDGHIVLPVHGTWGAAAAEDWRLGGVRYELAFRVRVPPMGLATFFVSTGWGVGGSGAGGAGSGAIVDRFALPPSASEPLGGRGGDPWGARAAAAIAAAATSFPAEGEDGETDGKGPGEQQAAAAVGAPWALSTAAQGYVARGCNDGGEEEGDEFPLPPELAAVGAVGTTTALLLRDGPALRAAHGAALAAAHAASLLAAPSSDSPPPAEIAAARRAFLAPFTGLLPPLASGAPSAPRLPRLALAAAAVGAEGEGQGEGVSTPHASQSEAGDATWALENACLRVEVDGLSGLLTAVTHKHAPAPSAPTGYAPLRLTLRQSFGYYVTSESGAYLFRPVGQPVDARGGAGTAGDSSVTVILPPPAPVPHPVGEGEEERPLRHGSMRSGRSSSAPLLLQELRMVGPHFSQSLRLTDVMGWTAGEADALTAPQLAARCADPLNPDGSLELRPTVSADGNQEVIMALETDIDVLPLPRGAGSPGAPASGSWSTNIRDNLNGRVVEEAVRDDGGEGEEGQRGGNNASWWAASGGSCAPAPPVGWWTSDGLGLLRRPPAPPDTPHASIQRHFYPMSALTRVAGRLVGAGAGPAANAPGASAWITLYSAQPFGTSTRAHRSRLPTPSEQVPGGSRVEVMVHRHLLRDDGRGLGTGVLDTTRLTARFSLTVGGQAAAPPASGAPTLRAGCGAAGQQPQPLEELHDDWLWAWATRSALHHAPLAVLHADLADLTRGAGTGPEGQEKESRPPFLPPPRDTSTQLNSLPYVAAEAGVELDLWRGRYSTRFAPLGGGSGEPPGPHPLWRLLPTPAAPAEGGATQPAFPADLAAACGAALWGSNGSTVGTALLAMHAALCGGLDAAPARGGLPPWVHLLSLHVRDAVTDDTVLRLHNTGGPAVDVDAKALLSGGGHAAAAAADASQARQRLLLPLRLTSLRPRTLTLVRHEAYVSGGVGLEGHHHPAQSAGEGPPAPGSPHVDEVTHRHRLEFRAGGAGAAHTSAAVSSVSEGVRLTGAAVRAELAAYSSASALPAAAIGGSREGAAQPPAAPSTPASLSAAGGEPGVGARQNTEEEGVFLSDAALEKMRADRGVPVPGEAEAPGAAAAVAAPPIAAAAPPVAAEPAPGALLHMQGGDGDEPELGAEGAALAADAAAPRRLLSLPEGNGEGAALAAVVAVREEEAAADAARAPAAPLEVTAPRSPSSFRRPPLPLLLQARLPPATIRSFVVSLAADDGEVANAARIALRAAAAALAAEETGAAYDDAAPTAPALVAPSSAARVPVEEVAPVLHPGEEPAAVAPSSTAPVAAAAEGGETKDDAPQTAEIPRALLTAVPLQEGLLDATDYPAHPSAPPANPWNAVKHEGELLREWLNATAVRLRKAGMAEYRKEAKAARRAFQQVMGASPVAAAALDEAGAAGEAPSGLSSFAGLLATLAVLCLCCCGATRCCCSPGKSAPKMRHRDVGGGVRHAVHAPAMVMQPQQQQQQSLWPNPFGAAAANPRQAYKNMMHSSKVV